MNKGILIAAAAVGLFAAGAAYANPVTYFGIDQDPGASTTHSDAAHNNFLSYLSSGVGTENFSSFADNTTPPITLSFPGSLSTTISATLSGSGSTQTGNNSGAVAHSGDSYYLVITGNQTNEFNISFDHGISAFGFYGSDISDSGSHLFLTLTDSSGDTHDVQVTQNTNNDSGNQLFFGFIDTSLTYTNILFKSDSSGDYFGFDDMTIGDIGQVTGNPNAVPEPGALGMLWLGLLGMISLLLLRKRADAKA